MRPDGTPGGCKGCPSMRAGSSFDGTHLWCEHYRCWTSLLGEFRGTCLRDWKEEERGHQMALL
nr:hypothetical protein [uncultured Olsenella sp.]